MKEQFTVNQRRDVSSSISAWLDGELNTNETARLVESVAQQAALSSACETYWLIGDILRDDAVMRPGFTTRVMHAISNEPTVLAPVIRSPEKAEHTEAPRWMPVAAAVAGVMVVGWMALSLNQPSDNAQNIVAAQGVSTPVVAPAISSARGGFNDDRAYMIAHQAYGSGAAMPSVAMYVRTVSNDRLDTGR